MTDVMVAQRQYKNGQSMNGNFCFKSFEYLAMPPPRIDTYLGAGFGGIGIHDRPITQDVSLDVWLKERGVRKGGLTADTAVLGL